MSIGEAWKTSQYNLDFLVNDFVRNNLVASPDAGLFPGYPACNLMYYILLTTLKPKIENVIIETGTAAGLSTSIILQALKDSKRKGKIYTIEIRDEPANSSKETFKHEETVSVIHGDSIKEITKLINENMINRIDFAYLDSCHESDYLYNEFNLIKDLVKKSNGLIYFDNTSDVFGERCDVWKAIKKIKQENDCNIINFPFCSHNPPGQAILSFEY
jgi:cephalosporin hydroxylase